MNVTVTKTIDDDLLSFDILKFIFGFEAWWKCRIRDEKDIFIILFPQASEPTSLKK